jgi:ATP-dependent RNA helicase SUPV3L1/SUV3
VAVAADAAPAREPREDKAGRPRERFEGKGREDRNKGKFRDRDNGGREGGGRDKGGRDKFRDRDKGGRESGPSHRQYATSAGPRDRDRPIDPNSPFAKLAALKEQLTANRKD